MVPTSSVLISPPLRWIQTTPSAEKASTAPVSAIARVRHEEVVHDARLSTRRVNASDALTADGTPRIP